MKTSTLPDMSAVNQVARQPWRRPEVRAVGSIGEILKAGSGKATVVGDPAEPGKVPGPDL